MSPAPVLMQCCQRKWICDVESKWIDEDEGVKDDSGCEAVGLALQGYVGACICLVSIGKWIYERKLDDATVDAMLSVNALGCKLEFQRIMRVTIWAG